MCMPVTLIVEPHPSGHRFEAVANVARLAGRTDEIVLLTSAGATASDEFAAYLTDVALKVEEAFDHIEPPTRQIAHVVAQHCREANVSTVVVMDADQSLKRWWYAAAAEFRGLPRRPRVVFMLTRYPAKLALTDRVGWKLRITKGTLALAAMATRTLHRTAGFAGRDDMTPGWLIKRARDPATCSAHSRDRAARRADLDLPADRRIVGIFGVLTDRKNPPLVLEAILASGCDADLLLAGSVKPDVAAWLAGLSDEHRARVVVHDGFLSSDLLDRLIASVDVVAIAMTNNGPSGIMGTALAAGVPVVSAGSQVRAGELVATDNGEPAEFTVAGFADALTKVFARDPSAPRKNTVPPATGETFAASLLGLDSDCVVVRRRAGRRSP
jgi:glycosyltransferase involved in cell wall biosynthesis